MRIARAQKKGAGAISEESPKFSCNTSRKKRAAVHVRGDYRDGACLTRNDERLCDGQRIQQAEAGAANVERTAGLTRGKSRMELSRKRRITQVGFAGGDDPIELFGSVTPCGKRLLSGAHP